MLTKEDLKAIRGIVREEIEAETGPLKTELRGEIKLARVEIQLDVRKISDRIKDLEIAVRKLQKDLNGVIVFFDNEYIKVQEKVEQIAEHLHLSAN